MNNNSSDEEADEEDDNYDDDEQDLGAHIMSLLFFRHIEATIITTK
jgi:hypothetical protein